MQRNFPGPKLGKKKFQRKDSLSFGVYPNFLTTQCRIDRGKIPCQNQLDSFSRFDRTSTCDRQTQTQRDSQIALSSRRAVEIRVNSLPCLRAKVLLTMFGVAVTLRDSPQHRRQLPVIDGLI